MNHLAHAWLAAPDPDLMFGSLIGDFVRGRIDPALPRGVSAGIALHRSIDVYTDAHAQTAAARALFAPPLRRYAGILIDVWFDHLLARDWSRYADESLHAFSRLVQGLLVARSDELPPRMLGFARYLRTNDLPEAYREREAIDRVLHGLSRRLRRANPLADAMPTLIRHERALAGCFGAFFPDLISYASRERARLLDATNR